MIPNIFKWDPHFGSSESQAPSIIHLSETMV